MNVFRKKAGALKQLFNSLGPGLITGASDDDPSGIATYSQAGAQFGLSTLWTALFTFPLMSAIQEMCARIGIVTQHGLTGVLKEHYPRWLLYFVVVLSCPAIVLNIGADIAGMGAVFNLMFPAIRASMFSMVSMGVLIIVMIKLPYFKIAAILKWLCAVLLVYLIVPFLVEQKWEPILNNTFVPKIHLNKEYLLILVAILGTTISPYLFFWQTSMEVESMRSRKKNIVVDKFLLPEMKRDVRYGMFFSALVMYFIILTAGSVLFPAGLHTIDTVEDAAKALQPLAGNLSYALFAIGVIGTGFLAIPVLAGSMSYIISNIFNWQEGLDKKFFEARGFYIVLIISVLVGMLINLTNISPVKALLYTAILYGVTAPVLIGVILHISNNRKVMGEYVNNTSTNIVGFITLALMSVAAILLLYYSFF